MKRLRERSSSRKATNVSHLVPVCSPRLHFFREKMTLTLGLDCTEGPKGKLHVKQC